MVRFPAVIDEFQSRFPKITLDLRAKSSKEIVEYVYVKDGRFDVGFVEGVTSAAELESHEMDSEELGVLLPQKHPLSTRKEIQFPDQSTNVCELHQKTECLVLSNEKSVGPDC